MVLSRTCIKSPDIAGYLRTPLTYRPAGVVRIFAAITLQTRQPWDHLRYALRDLDAVERGAGGTQTEVHSKQV